MLETIYNSILDETTIPQGAYEIIRGLDKNVRDISSEIYVFKREYNRDIADIKQELATIKDSNTKHEKNIERLHDDVAELKQEVKDLRRDVSDIKGDIKAIMAGFGTAQNRFNWGLVILGIFVALIQLLK